MTLRVLLDCDGVLCDFMTPALEVMNRILGTSKTLDDMRSWYLFDAFEPELVVSKEQRDACYDEWKKPGWCSSLQPLPGAVAAVSGMRRRGVEVVVVTSPMDGETWVYERDHWLRRKFGLDRDSIIPTNAKHAVAGDVFIDDKTEHCETWQRCYPDGTAIRWGTYTNARVPYQGLTLTDWGVVLSMVDAKSRDKKEHRQWTHKPI